MKSEQPQKSWLPLILAGLGFFVVTGGLIFAIQRIGVENIRAFIEQAGVFAPLIYMAIKAATYIFAPLSSAPLQFSAGVMFGFWQGTLYTLIGEVVGGSVSFFIARRYGREVVRRFVGEEGLQKVDDFVNQIVDWKTLIYARLFLFSIYDFISYAVGLTRLPFRTYVWVSTIIGAIPTAIAVGLGASLTEGQGESILLYGLIAVASAIPLIFQKRIRRWLKMDTPKDTA